ncbi:MAG: CopG family antitoxin [Gracilimonas sp.]|nr:CopG family antitoxin [Gracilimonas sp.]
MKHIGLPLLLTETQTFELYLFEDLARRRLNYMKASEFDEKFDNAEDITEMLDIKKAKRASQDLKRVNVDFPIWMVELLDQEAKRLGVSRQSIIKVWLAERLEKAS